MAGSWGHRSPGPGQEAQGGWQGRAGGLGRQSTAPVVTGTPGRSLGWGPAGAAGTELCRGARGPSGATRGWARAAPALSRLPHCGGLCCASQQAQGSGPTRWRMHVLQDWLLSDFSVENSVRSPRAVIPQGAWAPVPAPHCSLCLGGPVHCLQGATPTSRGKTWVLGKGEGKKRTPGAGQTHTQDTNSYTEQL